MKITESILKQLIKEEIASLSHKNLFENAVSEINLNDDMVGEGGALVNNEKITVAKAREIADELSQKISKRFDTECIMVGSAAVKPANELCGDVDLLIDKPFTKDNATEVKGFIEELGYNVENINVGLQVLSFVYNYDEDGEEKRTQVDIKFTKNMPWRREIGKSSLNSRFKNAIKELLIKCVIKATPLEGDDYKDQEFGDEYDGKYRGEKKGDWKYSMTSDDNLSVVFHSREGKRGPLKNPVINHELDKLITTDLFQAIKIAFGEEVTMNDIESVENIIDFLFSGKYKYADKERLDNIKERMIEQFDKHPNLTEYKDKFIELWDAKSNGLNESTNFGLSMVNIMRRMNKY